MQESRYPFTFRSPFQRTLVRVAVYRLGRALHRVLPDTRRIHTVKISRIAQLGAVAAIAALTLAGCASNEGGDTSSPAESDAPSLSGTLNGSGATSQQVAVQAWTAEFQTANPDVTVNYDPQGSGTGRESFQSGAVGFAGSDRAFKIDEIEAGPFDACVEGTDLVEIPAYVSPIAIAFNVEGVDELSLDPATLAGIFAGTITNWNDSRPVPDPWGS